MTSQTEKKQSWFATVYLFTYNSIETVGWFIVFLQLLGYYLLPNKENTSLYERLQWPLIIFQNAAVLEILHASLRLVSSSPIITTQQVFSRVMLVCGVIIPTVAAKSSIGLPLAVFAWSITEIIRYAYYALNLINKVPHLLVRLRYTTFIVLYPIGVAGELTCLYAAQEEVGETGLWSIDLPNFLNYSFHYQHMLLIVMALYVPYFPQMYLHMFSQRRKVLGRKASVTTGADKKEE